LRKFIKKVPAKYLGAIVSVIMVLIITWVVYYTDGTIHVYSHLMYLPIILSAVYCGWVTALGIALLSGILVSHWVMPLSVTQQLTQDPVNASIRAGLFLFVSVCVKAVFDKQRKNMSRYHDEISAMSKIQRACLNALVNLAETKDAIYTGQHIRRLEEYCRTLIEDIAMPQRRKEMFCSAIVFHDLGKVSIPDSILLKPGPLNEEEWIIMRKHASTGAHILWRIRESLAGSSFSTINEFLQIAIDMALYHHERYDGQGYPKGMAGEEIPFSARVAALCDVYDAARSPRSYKSSMSHQEAVELIKSLRGSQLDPNLVSIFLSKQAEFEAISQKHFIETITLMSVGTEGAA
jgi:putative two-component system response regulator